MAGSRKRLSEAIKNGYREARRSYRSYPARMFSEFELDRSPCDPVRKTETTLKKKAAGRRVSSAGEGMKKVAKKVLPLVTEEPGPVSRKLGEKATKAWADTKAMAGKLLIPKADPNSPEYKAWKAKKDAEAKASK